MAKRGEESIRKVRNDKKVCVQPVLSLNLKKELFRFSFLCHEPIKDTAERLCADGAKSIHIYDELCHYFRRNLSYQNHHYVGYLSRPRLTLIQGETEKVTIKFTQQNFEMLSNIAFALDLPLNQTAAILIKRTLNNRSFIAQYIQSHLKYLTSEEKDQIHGFFEKVWGFRNTY